MHSRSGQGQGRRSRQGQGRRSGQGVHSFDRDRDRDGDRDRDRDKECAQSIGTETGTPGYHYVAVLIDVPSEIQNI